MSYPKRVHYRERQRLRAADLRGEQEYLLALAGRHNVGVHGWGIVRGLGIDFTGGVLKINPGLAVDGYGRQLLLTDRVTVDLGKVAIEKNVYLHYCERPAGGCNGVNTIWRDSAEILLTDELLELPDEVSQLEDARASGRSENAGFWPVLLATISAVAQQNPVEFQFETDRSGCSFAGLIASRMVAPSGSALISLGRERLADPYPFRIAVRDSNGVQRDRFTIDFDGRTQLTGDLIVTGSNLEDVVVPVGDSQVVLSPRRSAGSRLTRKLVSKFENGKPIVVVELRDSKGQVEQTKILADPPDNRPASIVLSSLARPQFALLNVRPPERSNLEFSELASEATEAPSGPQPVPQVLDNSEKALKHRATILSLGAGPAPTETHDCSCFTESGSERRIQPTVEFIAKDKPPSVPTRDIYSLKEADSDQTSLRVSLGAFAEGDFRRHFSVGMRRTPVTDEDKVTFVRWLSMRGNGAVELHGGDESKVDRPDMLIVRGILTLPPVKPDPRDPLFKTLLQLCFLSGVLAHGASPLVAAVKSQPAFIETGQDWEYELTLSNVGRDFLRNPTGIEVFNSDPQPDHIPGLPDPLFNGTPQSVVVKHKGAEIPDGATSLVVMVTIGMDLASSGNKVAAQKIVGPITVARSPELNLSSLNSVPAGGSFFLTVQNRSNHKLNIPSGLIKVELPGPEVKLIELEDHQILPNQTTKTVSKIALPDGGTYKVAATLDYNWPERVSLSILSVSQTLNVQQQFSGSVKTDPSPVEADKPWTYSLKIRSHSQSEISLSLLRVRTYVSGSVPPNFTDFVRTETLKKDEFITQENLAGVAGPSGTEVLIELQLSYVREGVTWDNVARTIKVTIP